LQIRGQAEKLKGLESLKVGAKLLVNIVPAFMKYIDPNDVKKLKTAGIYKITPQIIKFFNKDLFSKTGYKVYG